ncbi:MAG: class I SAM-dependent methyltransferase [Chloroflexi bacterium]|nr:MAG: class I SAM-dependent methyltransferase [Chloroflexota bacterium]
MSVLKGRWEKAAEAYATGEHKSGRELELVVEFAGPQGREHVLDIGAGAGHTALALAPHVRSVVVTDPVEAMLGAARRVFEQAGVRNAEFMPASAERLPFQDGAFDIVTSRLAAHHFEDVPHAGSRASPATGRSLRLRRHPGAGGRRERGVSGRGRAVTRSDAPADLHHSRMDRLLRAGRASRRAGR